MPPPYDDDLEDDDEAGDGTGRDIPDVLPGEEDRFQVFMPAVQQLVNALGGYEEVPTEGGKFETIYRPGDSVLAVLKDLKKLWRKDDTDDERTVARCMAKAGLMKELVALVKECAPRGDWGRKVSLIALDLIAALTWPIDVGAELKEMEDEGEAPPDYASLLRYQVEYKAMILQAETLRHLLNLLIPSFARAGQDEKEDRVISLGLHVVRNLLAIKDVVAEGTAMGAKEELSTLQASSTLMMQLEKFTYLELLLTLASESHKSEFNPFNVLVLDMVYLIFRSVRMQDLAMDQKRAPMENLKQLLELEDRQKARTSRANPTRHSRFGTTIAVRAPTQKLVLHSQTALTLDTGKLLDDVKKTRKPMTKLVDDPSANTNLSPAAITVLQKFSRDFLDSFNDFFKDILQDIQRERQKVRPSDPMRALFVSRFMVEYLMVLRKKAPKANVDEELPLGLVAEIAEPNTLVWVVARIRMSMDNRPTAWNELQSGIDCFTQTLLLLDAMSQSDNDDDREIAEYLQNKIYYHGDVLDTSLEVFTLWKPGQRGMPITFLDCTVHFAYVLLRMLEKYSKSKTFMFVRKRHRPQRKKKDAGDAAPIPEEYQEEEQVEQADDAPSYKEHAFTFAAFEKRFAMEAVTKNLLAYLSRYHTLDADQLRRVVNLVHRQVVKGQAEGLYFTIPALHLFRKILDQKDSLPKGHGARELVQVITYILRRFFKQVEKEPWVIVEAALPKGRAQWQHLSRGHDDDDDGIGGERSRVRENLAAAELEFIKKNNVPWSQQMGVVISLLVSASRESWIKEVISALEIALASRQQVVLRVDGDGAPPATEDDDDHVVRNFAGPSKDAIEKFEVSLFSTSDEAFQKALTMDQHVKLMFSLLKYEKDDTDAEALKWALPSSVVPADLEASIGALNQFLVDPLTIDDPKKLLRKKQKPRQRMQDDDDEEGLEDRPKKRRARKVAEVQQFKSAAFIYDSDDDDEADRAFFAREEEIRAQQQRLAEESGNTMRATGTKKRKRNKKGEDAVAAVATQATNDIDMDDSQDVLNAEMASDSDSGDDSDDERPRIRRRSIAAAASREVEDEDEGVQMEASEKEHLSRVDPDESDAGSGAGTPMPVAAPRRTQRIVDSDDDE